MTSRRRTRRMTATAAVLGGLMVLGACSSSSTGASSKQPPEAAVSSALGNLGRQSSVRVVLSLPITVDQAQQIAKAGGSTITPQEAKALTTGTVFFSETTGAGEAVDSTQAMTDPKDAFDVGFSIGSDTPVEIRYVDQNLYVRAQLSQLLTDVGQPPTKADKVINEVSSLDTYVPGLKALAQGSWVEVSHAALQSLAPMLKQIQGQSGTTPSGLEAQLQQLRTQVLAAVKANSTYAARPGGGYSVTVNVANLLQTVKPAIASALSGVPGVGGQLNTDLGKAGSAIPPGQTAVIDLQVSSGRLSEADVDLNQFAKQKMTFPVPLRMAFSSPGMPGTPSGATPLDLSKLPTLIGSLLGGKKGA